MKTEMTFDEMKAALVIADQTIGCENCWRAWWGDDHTPNVEDFHADGCPLKGRKDVHESADFD